MDLILIFISLLLLEICLGLDNILSFAFLIAQVDQQDRHRIKIISLAIAFAFRILLLMTGLFLTNNKLSFHLLGFDLNVRSCFFIIGGAFLVIKSLYDLKQFLNPEKQIKKIALSSILMQIILIDFIFSVDSILTAIAITSHMEIIIVCIVLSMIFMFYSTDIIIHRMTESTRFNILGLLLVSCVGLFLITEGFALHIDKTILLTIIISTISYEIFVTYFIKLMKKTALELDKSPVNMI
jgi:predicted tellurium resistance membrane protein TerC